MADTLKTDWITSDAESAVQTLMTRIVDVKKGFDKVVAEAEGDFRSVAEEFHALHAAHLDNLQDALTEHGYDMDADGSFMSTVNEKVVALRANIDDIDEDIMSQIRSGEQHVLNAFDDAQNKVNEDALRLRLKSMRGELRSLIENTRHLG